MEQIQQFFFVNSSIFFTAKFHPLHIVAYIQNMSRPFKRMILIGFKRRQVNDKMD